MVFLSGLYSQNRGLDQRALGSRRTSIKGITRLGTLQVKALPANKYAVLL
jgi:hypothetical protein